MRKPVHIAHKFRENGISILINGQQFVRVLQEQEE